MSVHVQAIISELKLLPVEVQVQVAFLLKMALLLDLEEGSELLAALMDWSQGRSL